MTSSDNDLMLLMLLNINNKEKNTKTRKYWMYLMKNYPLKNANTFGTFSIPKELDMYPEKFRDLYGISRPSFEILAELVQPILHKNDTK